MRRLLGLLVCLCLAPHVLAAQTRYGGAIYVQTSVPTDTGLAVGMLWYDTTASVLKILTATPSTWATIGWAAGAVPSGAIVFVASGSCPSSYTEVSALNGRMMRGTVAANADVGGTGGSDSVTPTFTGTAWAAPAIAWPVGVPTFTGSSVTSAAVSAGTPAGTNAAITAGTPAGTISALTTGADSSTTGGVAKAVAQTPTFTGSALATHTHLFTGAALGTHTHTTTATGTIAWPAGVPTIGAFTPAGTLGAIDTRAAYAKLIGCSKN